MDGGSLAEEKISAALNKELEAVEKECMRSMQVGDTKSFSLYVRELYILVRREKPFCAVPSVARTGSAHRRPSRSACTRA